MQFAEKKSKEVWFAERMFHLTAHPETEALVFSGDSSNHSNRTDPQGFTKLQGLLFNLLSQLTGRGQDHSVRTLVWVFNPAASQ